MFADAKRVILAAALTSTLVVRFATASMPGTVVNVGDVGDGGRINN
jgi:hypothetical protein